MTVHRRTGLGEIRRSVVPEAECSALQARGGQNGPHVWEQQLETCSSKTASLSATSAASNSSSSQSTGSMRPDGG
eukprot:CAMPEP_0175295028 /NCGR_PEP_ID=MMETSP0093-20121207/58305_1 /TAXON_ID=311494 /ORGANISM="Alexandrium monilatum, Strain CCMP3105" /LENGTH=74 /DNA_ID=CAMNT_0016590987 /DNA_START=80 /DNA_END=301 /DNA_ORIENTATION=+